MGGDAEEEEEKEEEEEGPLRLPPRPCPRPLNWGQ